MGIERISEFWPEWKIEGCVGEGTYGKVYKVFKDDPNMKSYSAVKVISLPDSAAELESLRAKGMDSDAIKAYYERIIHKYINDLKVLESLKGHANILSVEGCNVIEKNDSAGWEIFVRTELLEPFKDYTQRHPLDEKEMIRMAIDVSRALEEFHNNGLIHRDIKPANIFVTANGDFKLGDPGMEKEIDKSLDGPCYYLAPELVHGKDYDSTVDIYSLGLVMYSMLNANRPPFVREAVPSLNERRTAESRRLGGEELIPPTEATPELAKIVLCACSFDAKHRFKNPTEFKNALENFLNPPPKVAAVPKPEPTVPPKNIVPISDAEAEKIIKKFKRKKKSGKGPLILLIILLIAVLGAASVFTVLALLDNKDDKSKVEEKEPVDEIIDITEAEETEPSVIIPKDSETQDDEEKDNEAFVIPCSDGTSAHIPQEEWVVMNEPTYLEEGRRVKLCSQCDKIAVDEPIPVLEYEGFSDVPKDAWYATAVEHCVVQGYFSGYSDGSFKPDDVLTREAFATILARASGAELDSYTDVIFEDVKSGDWFMSSVLWAADMGYMTGVGDGTSFGVGKAVNRQEIAVIFHRYAVSVGVTVEKDINLEDYSDHESIADWAKDSVSWAISYGLLGSTSTDMPTFSPEKTVTRAQAAQIFKNFNNFTVTNKTEEITEENTEENTEE